MPNKSQPFTLEQGLERGWTLSILAAATAVTSALNKVSLERQKGQRFAIWANENIQDLYGYQGET